MSKPQRGFSNKQIAALSAAAPLGVAAVGAMRRAFVAQRNGAGRGNGAQRGRPAPRRRRAGRALNMPENLLYQERGGRTDFTGQTTKALQRQAWTVDPASSNMMAPRGLGYYDAFSTFAASAMTHLSIGPATPIVAKTTCLTPTGDPISTDWKYSAQMLVVGPAPGVTQAVLYRESSGVANDPVDIVSYDSTQLVSDTPTETIPTRCSLRVRNFTNQYNVGGLVRVLRATTGMYLDPDYTSNEALGSLMQGVRDHRRTVTYTGPEFLKAMQKNAIVADQSRSLWFQDNDVIAKSGQLPWFQSHYDLPYVLPDSPPGSGTPQTYSGTKDVYDFTGYIANPTFTPLIVIFEPYGSATAPAAGGANTYEVIVQSQFLAHYRQGSMLANMAIEPKSDHAALEKHRNHEEARGSVMQAIGSGLQAGGKWAWDHKMDILGAGALLM